MLIFCDFIQVFVFTTNHHLKTLHDRYYNHLVEFVLEIGHNMSLCRNKKK